MISLSDRAALADSLAQSDDPCLPASFCAHVADVLGVSDITISISGTDDEFTLGASSDDVRTLDDWAFTFQEDASRETPADTAYTVPNTADANTTHWPRLSAKAHAMGYRSLAAVPLHLEGRTFGTIRLHDRTGPISTETLDDTERLATEFAPFIVKRFRRRVPPIDGQADRHQFHQAIGMVMVQMAVAAAVAVEVLRDYATSHDRLLTDVAGDVVSRRLQFQATPPAGGG